MLTKLDLDIEEMLENESLHIDARGLPDRTFLRMLESGCYNYVESVWDRYEFEHCNKLQAWKRRSNFLVSISTK